MKKIVIIATTIIIAAVAAQAQSPRVEVMMADTGFKDLAPKKSSTPKSSWKKFQNAIERQVAQQQAQIADSAQKAAAQTTAKTQASAPQKATATANDESGVFAWIKAIVLGGPMPGESTESYRLRLEAQAWPASQPYK